MLLLATVITALAVAVTCALTIDTSGRVKVSNTDTAKPITSQNYTNTTGTNIQTYINNGTFTNGNTITYSYNGGSYSVTIPQGKWRWELWGARGGNSGSYSANSGTANGGYGGYVKAEVTYSAATTIYIYVGGTGAGGTGTRDQNHTTRTGGYNGGGNGIGSRCGGGGGATDIRTTGGAATTASSYNTRKLVAAGGGGGEATGTTQTHTSNGVYFGGSGCTTKHNGNYCNDESGGGGGYNGGKCNHGDDPYSSYSGSNFVASGYTQVTNSLGYSGASGNGKVVLTAVSINQAPVAITPTLSSGKVRGTAVNYAIAASALAKDNDYANYSGGKITNVYFTNGTSSNYDTLPSANNGLFLNSACTLNASSYMTYSWTTTTLTIKTITKLPRAGVEGQNANQFVLYTRVRDGFGSTTTRGVAVVSFKMNVTDQPITVKASYNVNGKYKFGDATDKTYNTAFNYQASYTDGKIYNPLGTGASYKTIFIPKPLSPTDTSTTYTISATELFTDADTAYDNVAFKSITASSGYTNLSSYYSIVLNSNTSYATGLSPSFTLKTTGVRPTNAPFVVMQIVAQTSEKNSKAAIGGTLTIYLVFRISNTRPYFGSTNVLATKLAEPHVSVAVGGTAQINLKNFIYDIDDGSNLKATFAQGASDLKVPTYEYIQVDMLNNLVPLATNVNSNYATYTASNNLASNSKTTGEGTIPTYFKAASVAANGSSGASTANVTYRYVNTQTIEFTGKSASQNQYRTTGGANYASRKGHFYVLVRVIDPTDTADNGIWFPISIEVTSQTPTPPATYANVTLSFSGYNAGTADSPATLGTGVAKYLTPIGYLDSAGALKGIGTANSGSTAAIPFVLDKDAFLMGGALNDFTVINGSSTTAIVDNTATTTGSFFKVEFETLSAPKSYFAMIPDASLSSYGITISGTQCTFNGIKITPLRSTNGEYLQFSVNVKDTHNKTASIGICVKVENRAVSPRLDPSQGAYGINELKQRRTTLTTPYGEYAANPGLGNEKVVNYTLEALDELQITPYDYAYDFDIDPDGSLINKSVYNSNPFDAGFAGVADKILTQYNVSHGTTPFTSAKAKSNFRAQQLSFVNAVSVASSYDSQYSNYISVSASNQSTIKSGSSTIVKDIPSIKIKGIARTSSAIVQLQFGITDGVDVVNFKFTITVLNSAPMLNTLENHRKGDGGDDFRLDDYYVMTAYPDASSMVKPNVWQFTATQIAYDKDGDTPTFDTDSIKIVAKEGNNYYEHLYFENGAYHGYVPDPDGSNAKAASITLSDYISAMIAKGAGGADVLRIQGLSSTELINLPIYVEFIVRDGYRAQPQSSTLHLLVGVENTSPYFVGDSLLRTDSPEQYTWLISYEVNSELSQRRYLFNSRELLESSLATGEGTPITIAENNKVYLFDDYDSQQHVMLNPRVFPKTGGVEEREKLVAKYDNRENVGGETVYKEVTQANVSGSDYDNAAVIYTPMYDRVTGDDGYITVRIRFFYKKVTEGVTSFVEYRDNDNIEDCEYWAIELEDTHTGSTPHAIQIMLSVKDSHHGKRLYTTPEKTASNTSANVSERQVFNLYYNYRRPGILAMHTYYRTDGNAESKIVVSDDPVKYLVDHSNISTAELEESYRSAYSSADDAGKQNILGYAKFIDSFKYRYFERTYTTMENGSNQTYLTYKHYPQVDQDSMFTYSPIQVNPSAPNPEAVPMSYIALPKGVGDKTEGMTHVTFANVGINSSGGNELVDSDYQSWDPKSEKVFKNITISDGINTYPALNNPYIDISYFAGEKSDFTQSYINNQRFTLHGPGQPEVFKTTDYREDRYGFKIKKLEGGKRATGLLKMTIALKTIDSSGESEVEMVEVEINLLDAMPLVKAFHFENGTGYYETSLNSRIIKSQISMTMGETDVPSGNNPRYSKITFTPMVNKGYEPTNGDFGKIFYKDEDEGDTVKFYVSSAFQGGLTEADMAKLNENTAIKNEYYAVDPSKAGKSDYDPNPNYKMFFDVSPSTGSSDALQFIPKAKTTPNLNGASISLETYCQNYNLKIDEHNQVYYPFRVLFFDEYKGSSFTEGWCFIVVINVYIDNSELAVNTKVVKDKYSADHSSSEAARYNNTPKYIVNLSQSSEFYVDVSSLLSDDDIVLEGNRFTVESDLSASGSAWSKLSEQERYLRDYLKMPAATDYVDLTKADYGISTDPPFTVSVGGSGAYSSLPPTTLVFKTAHAFKDIRDLCFTFYDSNATAEDIRNGIGAKIVFSVVYNNDTPSANANTFGGASNSVDISMKTGDKIYLYASDYTLFENDKDSGYSSYADVKAKYSSLSMPTTSAADMAASFKYFSSRYGNSEYTGDSIILGTDDAATTLRIIGVESKNGIYLTIDYNNSTNRDYMVPREFNSQNGYLRVTITADGVVQNEPVYFTLEDAHGKKTEVTLRVNVISSAPVAKTTGLPSGVTYVADDGDDEVATYAIELNYGGSKSISLRQLMNDIDSMDNEELDVYSDMGGNQFTVSYDGGNAVVSALVTKSGGYNQITINAIDFINKRGNNEYATVSFRVTDKHNTVSSVVSIRVKIVPQQVSSVLQANRSLAVTVMSYADFIDTDNAGEPQEVAIVENDGAKLFKDVDVDAPSAMYNVSVYIMLKQNDAGTMVNATNKGDYCLLYTREGVTEGDGEEWFTDDAVAKYVLNYFNVSTSEDGKKLLFTPNSVSVRNNTTAVSSIPLYIEVAKRYNDNTVMEAKGAQMDVTVSNSRLMATESNSLNVGYPTITRKVNDREVEDMRDAGFLEFTGSKGDSLTWNLYDLDDPHLGLFYDYDLINFREEDGGKETITYLDYSYSVPNETVSSANDPVLSVSRNGTGSKQTVTITINRNVCTGQPNPAGEENVPTSVDVYIYAVDQVNNVAGVSKNDTNRVAVTKITVNIQNDRPEISHTGVVTACPYCGKTNVNQTSARQARCSDCNKTFKSLDPDQLGYILSFDSDTGYMMDLTLKNSERIEVYIADIIDDADIDMDAYVMLNTGNENSLMGRDGPVTYIRAGDENAFRAEYNSAANKYKVTTLSYFTFTCLSTTRDAVAVCTVQFRDSFKGSTTSVLTIRLTVGNIAPTVKNNASRDLTVMGIGPNATDEQLEAAYAEFNILDYITDANGDNFDPNASTNSGRRPTYTYIDEITVYTTSADSAVNRPRIYGPNYLGEVYNEETGETDEAPTVDSVCMVNWVGDDMSHQKFRVEPMRGIYGVQRILLKIYDSGYEAGLAAGIQGELLELVLTITIANPLDDVEEVLNELPLVYGVTKTILPIDLLGEENSQGYEIINMQEVGNSNYLRIYKPDGSIATSADGGDGNWHIKAATENVKVQVKVTFSTEGGLTRERILPIHVIANNKPKLKNDNSSYRYTVSMLDDKTNRTIKIRPTDWFVDDDAEDIMTFISPVESSQSVKVEVHRAIAPESEGGQPYLLLKFLRRGESVITVNLTDLSGRSYTYKITVNCTDAPEPNGWENFMSLIEANWLWFWIIVGGALLLIILLIVIIVVVHKKRKMRREIEALLESETELEQEMMRLSMGAAAFPSFGYLPPTPQGGVNPGMMLGGGQTAPQQNSLQLNAGTGTPPPQQPTTNNIPPQGQGVPPTPPPMNNDGFDPNNF